MRRYCTKPRANRDDWDANGTDFLARTVYELDPKPIPTGLLDARGNELYAVEEMAPIGFVKFRQHS